jgi:hypothetical protein
MCVNEIHICECLWEDKGTKNVKFKLVISKRRQLLFPPSHAMAPGTVTSLQNWPLVDIELNMSVLAQCRHFSLC